MKAFFTLMLVILAAFSLRAQVFSVPDTLINENFETDPTSDMLPFPSGNDQEWINYDEDHLTGLCVNPGSTPFGFWQEGDLGAPNSDNDAYTSCSYLVDPDVRNENWLITSPVTIPDSSYWLCWRSLSYYGPGFLDGYHVMVSTTTNDPTDGSFKDTLFSAAEMVFNSSPAGSLNVNDYVFSGGYIQANSYTDTSYFFIDNSEGPPFYHGKLEPHARSLANYAGKTIYVAFLHDSKNNFLLQLDDIIVSNTHTTAASNRPGNISYLRVMPNPLRSSAYVSWKTDIPLECLLTVTDGTGRVVLQRTFSSRDAGNYFLDAQSLEPGVYYCSLQTSRGRATVKFVKL